MAEPSTLIPHYLETTTKFRATLRRPGEADIAVADLDQTVYRYSGKVAKPPRSEPKATRRRASGPAEASRAWRKRVPRSEPQASGVDKRANQGGHLPGGGYSCRRGLRA